MAIAREGATPCLMPPPPLNFRSSMGGSSNRTTTHPVSTCNAYRGAARNHHAGAGLVSRMPGISGRHPRRIAISMSDLRTTQHWSVTVTRNGEDVITISSNGLSGRELSVEDEKVIRTAADHLLAFVGKIEDVES